jgi:hypothetical protein
MNCYFTMEALKKVLKITIGDNPTFMIGLDDARTHIELSVGESNIKVIDIDKSLEQAVVSVAEKEHVVMREKNYFMTNHEAEKMASRGEGLGLSFPEGSTFTVQSITNLPGGWHVRVEVNVPAVTHYFLIGRDDTHYFVSSLPKEPISVAHAHEILRPKWVPKDSHRQGEWFFVPASERDVKECLDQYQITPRMEIGGGDGGHTACGLLWLQGDIVIGWIKSEHHKSLYLHTWHRVVHNLELPINSYYE